MRQSTPETIGGVWLTWMSEGTSWRRRWPRRRGGVGRITWHTEGAEPSVEWEALVRPSRTAEMDGGVRGRYGIDLARRGHEVRRLFFAGGFTRVLARENLDPEEVLQEIYRGLLARNRGTCPWDATKSSFGHYVHIVIRCVLANYLRKERRKSSMERVTEDGVAVEGEGVAPQAEEAVAWSAVRRALERRYVGEERDRARRLLTALAAGTPRKEAAAALGGTTAWVESVLKSLRDEVENRNFVA